MGDCGREADRVQNSATADRDDIATAVQVRDVEDLKHSLKDVNVVLDLFPAGNKLDVADTVETIREAIGKCPDAGGQSLGGRGYVAVQPKLNSGTPVPRRLEQLRQYFLIDAKHVRCKPQSVYERYCEVDVQSIRVVGVAHAAIPGRVWDEVGSCQACPIWGDSTQLT